MAISEKQLEIWSHQGAITTSSLTYDLIKSCIDKIIWNPDVTYEIYLQGSYKNSTNIRGNSDVDITVQFNSSFNSNKETFGPEQLKEFNDYYPDAKYNLDDYKKPLIMALTENYGQENVKVGNKSIKVKGTNGRLDADIICCLEYRKYSYFSRLRPNGYVSGIIFWEERTGKRVINYPKLHYDNGVQKNKDCESNYKSAIRILKNMKASMVDKAMISEELAPSYFIECLLYNVLNNKFKQPSYHDLTYSIMDFLAKQSDNNKLTEFICQNSLIDLFGTSDQQWNIQDCKLFLLKLIDFWNEG